MGPDTTLVKPGKKFNELYFVCQGIIVISEPDFYREPILAMREGSIVGLHNLLNNKESMFEFRTSIED